MFGHLVLFRAKGPFFTNRVTRCKNKPPLPTHPSPPPASLLPTMDYSLESTNDEHADCLSPFLRCPSEQGLVTAQPYTCSWCTVSVREMSGERCEAQHVGSLLLPSAVITGACLWSVQVDCDRYEVEDGIHSHTEL